MVGQFIVQYDVDRKSQGNEIQVLDGYFVHYFAPDQLPPLPRHVVFVLDISGSMTGVKLQQTKDAMVTILEDMTDQDYFNILTFSDDIHHWTPKESKNTNPVAYQGHHTTKSEALKYVLDLETLGGTNINDALLEALDVMERAKISEKIPTDVKPIIIFLTDGQATTGEINNHNIQENVKKRNQKL